jgi:hypothetical protein
MAERCVCCGEIIPEGRQVCPNCEKVLPKKPMTNEDHFRDAISTEDGLAKFLMVAHDAQIITIKFCQNKKECWDECPAILDEKCMECMKEWMKKPYEGD